MTSLLFICHGNICRSPMAQSIFVDLARRAGREQEFLVDSAAVSREELGSPLYPPAAQELARQGVSAVPHRARLVTPDDYARFDRLLVMDYRNERRLLSLLGGDPEEKISLLLQETGRPREVADPWYTGDFSTAFADIREGCEALLAHL